jgi:hypothetical protein
VDRVIQQNVESPAVLKSMVIDQYAPYVDGWISRASRQIAANRAARQPDGVQNTAALDLGNKLKELMAYKNEYGWDNTEPWMKDLEKGVDRARRELMRYVTPYP